MHRWRPSFLARALLVAIGLGAAACLPQGASGPVPVHPALVDDVVAARQHLEALRTSVRLASGDPAPSRIVRLAELGLFVDADSLLARAAPRTLDLVIAEAELRFRQYHFAEARELVDAILAQRPRHRAARLLGIRLAIQAWQLDWAQEQVEALLARGRRDPAAALLLARIRLHQGEGDAIDWARRARQWDPSSGRSYLLEAEAHLAAGRMAEAETALRRSLELQPLDADARFAYGYALWRRSAPALLPAMSAQWQLALELDPLHLPTHWHLGNGYTPRDYRDYAPFAASEVRSALASVDSLIARGLLHDAIAETRALDEGFAGSVLPALYRASAWYLLGDSSGTAALDSAQRTFRTILSVAPGFGPAHNGVAAVLRRRQTRSLARYDSLESALGFQPVTFAGPMERVFSSLDRNDGRRTARMIAQQLGPASAYLPLLDRLEAHYRVFPLHHDLAAATGDASFRVSATEDLRRWMDVRAAGGPEGAAVGIEALEKGSYQGRSVLLHEFVHLIDSFVLTDAQRRRVRELYRDALQEDRTLDHYAATHPREFLAQAVEAYASMDKVHPLNPKAANTREELRRKDPASFTFVEELFAGLERALAGDEEALRSNWAEVYVHLARRALRGEAGGEGNPARAAALLDSALVRDPAYLPAMIAYAVVEGARGRPARAEQWLLNAEGIDPDYSPVPAARSRLLSHDEGVLAGTLETRASLLRRAAQQERDPLLRGRYVRELWELYAANGRLTDALAVAEDYATVGSTVTPPLRALREEAVAGAMRMRLRAGYTEEALPYFRQRVSLAAVDREMRRWYAEALRLAGMRAEAKGVLEESAELLSSAGAADPRISLLLAEMRLAEGDTAGARALIEPLLSSSGGWRGAADASLVRLLVSMGQRTEAQRQLALLPEPLEPSGRAELAFTRGWITAWRGDAERAEELYREAVAFDPYHFEARLALYRLLQSQGRANDASALMESGKLLPLPLGPAFDAAVAEGPAAAGVSGDLGFRESTG